MFYLHASISAAASLLPLFSPQIWLPGTCRSISSLPWGPLGQLHHSCRGGAARCKQTLIPRPPQEKFDPQSPLGPQGPVLPWPGCNSGPGGSGLCHLQAMLTAWHLRGSCHITQPSRLMSHRTRPFVCAGFRQTNAFNGT